MTAEAVFALLRRRPFAPFRLILHGGTTYDVLHPQMMMVTRSGITIGLYDRDQHSSPDEIPARTVLVAFLHVTAAEDLPQPMSKAG